MGGVLLPARTEAMVDVGGEQGALVGRHGLLHRLDLDGDLGAGPTGVGHLDDVAEVPVGALQALDEGGVGRVSMRL